MWGQIQGSFLVFLKPVSINEILLRKLAIRKVLHLQNDLSISFRMIVLVCKGLIVRTGDKKICKRDA